MMKRTFIAVRIDAGPRLAEMMTDIKAALTSESIRWVDINQMHITLSFIGDTSEQSVKDISEMLKEKCSNFGRAGFTLASLGVFRNLSDPRVVWAGISGADRLVLLQKVIRKGLDELGIQTEEREFRPHLTLGRIKRLRNRHLLEETMSQYRDMHFQDVTVSEVVYYESILSQTGSTYFKIKTVKL